MTRAAALFFLTLAGTLPHAARPHEAVYTVRGRDGPTLQAIRKALAVEAADPLPGARVRLEPGPDALSFSLHIEAQDLAHLRAATNSYLKWLAATEASLQAADGAAPDRPG